MELRRNSKVRTAELAQRFKTSKGIKSDKKKTNGCFTEGERSKKKEKARLASSRIFSFWRGKKEKGERNISVRIPKSEKAGRRLAWVWEGGQKEKMELGADV